MTTNITYGLPTIKFHCEHITCFDSEECGIAKPKSL